MDKFKVEEFRVVEKGKEYSVLVFPKIEYMWAFDDNPEEDCYMVDGTAEVYSALKYAMAILSEASDKIIYFPCKQNGIGRYYDTNYNLILCTPKVQLRRSSWISIRRKLNSGNKTGNYVLRYNRKKLDDFCEKTLMIESRRPESKLVLRTEVGKKIEKAHLEEVLGDNLFIVLGKEECIHNHYLIAKDLDEYCAGDDYGAWSAMGWIITQKGLKNMKERADQDRK